MSNGGYKGGQGGQISSVICDSFRVGATLQYEDQISHGSLSGLKLKYDCKDGCRMAGNLLPWRFPAEFDEPTSHWII